MSPTENGMEHGRHETLDDGTVRKRGGVRRRDFFAGMIGAAVAAPLALTAATGTAATAAAVTAGETDSPATMSPQQHYRFEGRHQQGILTPAQSSAAFVSFDATAANRAELADLMRTITERARFLTAGGSPASVGITAPPSDSGVLGPEVVADGLTVTASLGASLFDDRYGLSASKPSKLRTMEDFPNDSLDRSRCDGDLLLQLCAHNSDTVIHALRDIARATRGGMQVRWRQDGFVSPPRPSGTPRNLMGFKDGTSNPDVTDADEMDRLVWAGSGEPTWAAGGSYHVVRTIRMLVEFWDRVNLHEQESMIGRRRDSGAPLSASGEFDDPHYELDPSGDAVPLGAHVRAANPRTPGSESSRLLRRAYNYNGGVDSNGNLDMGLVFVAFNQDLERQFVAVQRRLADEPLVDYIAPVGGGYFYAVPGVRDADDWLASGLLA